MKFAMICASNVNRSVAAHEVLMKAGMDVDSFGVGAHVKIPGPDGPLRYNFGAVSYSDIYNDLKSKASEDTSLIEMMKRNIQVKDNPQRWQDRSKTVSYDVAICFEQRVWDIVVGDLRTKEDGIHPCLAINMDVKDNASEAKIASQHALLLSQLIESSDDWESEIDDLLDTFSEQTGRKKPQYDICFSINCLFFLSALNGYFLCWMNCFLLWCKQISS